MDCHDARYGRYSRLWRCEYEGEALGEENGLKLCVRRLRLIEKVPARWYTAEELVRIAIASTARVLFPGLIPVYETWAAKWLSGKDRSAEAARVASNIYAVADAFAYAARAAAYAAYAVAKPIDFAAIIRDVTPRREQ